MKQTVLNDILAKNKYLGMVNKWWLVYFNYFNLFVFSDRRVKGNLFFSFFFSHNNVGFYFQNIFMKEYFIPFYIFCKKLIFLGLTLTMFQTSGKWIFQSRRGNAIYFHKIFNNLWHVKLLLKRLIAVHYL